MYLGDLGDRDDEVLEARHAYIEQSVFNSGVLCVILLRAMHSLRVRGNIGDHDVMSLRLSSRVNRTSVAQKTQRHLVGSTHRHSTAQTPAFSRVDAKDALWYSMLASTPPLK